ncbi:hypothetical protein Cadr_000003896 [Camelus dromedarius]|uniref:Uncharacterized protein n=1 Tax=Camelus dromedarius TaxID=9838 RepID=A0A5N4EAW3_CAMDR|nr:hypothetical protein Cadr_000003896 [Camelus dromedarius]
MLSLPSPPALCSLQKPPTTAWAPFHLYSFWWGQGGGDCCLGESPTAASSGSPAHHPHSPPPLLPQPPKQTNGPAPPLAVECKPRKLLRVRLRHMDESPSHSLQHQPPPSLPPQPTIAHWFWYLSKGSDGGTGTRKASHLPPPTLEMSLRANCGCSLPRPGAGILVEPANHPSPTSTLLSLLDFYLKTIRNFSRLGGGGLPTSPLLTFSTQAALCWNLKADLNYRLRDPELPQRGSPSSQLSPSAIWGHCSGGPGGRGPRQRTNHWKGVFQVPHHQKPVAPPHFSGSRVGRDDACLQTLSRSPTSQGDGSCRPDRCTPLLVASGSLLSQRQRLRGAKPDLGVPLSSLTTPSQGPVTVGLDLKQDHMGLPQGQAQTLSTPWLEQGLWVHWCVCRLPMAGTPGGLGWWWVREAPEAMSELERGSSPSLEPLRGPAFGSAHLTPGCSSWVLASSLTLAPSHPSPPLAPPFLPRPQARALIMNECQTVPAVETLAERQLPGAGRRPLSRALSPDPWVPASRSCHSSSGLMRVTRDTPAASKSYHPSNVLSARIAETPRRDVRALSGRTQWGCRRNDPRTPGKPGRKPPRSERQDCQMLGAVCALRTWGNQECLDGLGAWDPSRRGREVRSRAPRASENRSEFPRVEKWTTVAWFWSAAMPLPPSPTRRCKFSQYSVAACSGTRASACRADESRAAAQPTASLRSPEAQVKAIGDSCAPRRLPPWPLLLMPLEGNGPSTVWGTNAWGAGPSGRWADAAPGSRPGVQALPRKVIATSFLPGSSLLVEPRASSPNFRNPQTGEPLLSPRSRGIAGRRGEGSILETPAQLLWAPEAPSPAAGRLSEVTSL